jgi:hypothetical protein
MPNPIDRRSFLRSSGVAIALPALDAMVSRRQAVAAEGSGVDVPRRMVAINVGLGLHVPNLYPEMSGRDYKITPYLEPLRDLKNNFTVISGASHPEVDGGHHSEKSFLTAIPHPNSAGFRNSISIDQIAAEKIGIKTRYAYLCLSLAGRGLSWSRSGVEIPSATRPSGVFARMFLEGKADEKARTIQQLKDGQSIMDSVLAEAKSMNCRLGVRDRQKLDQFFTAVRSTETRLQKQESWEHRPKPQVDAKPPRDITDRTDIIGKARLMYDMMYLALQTDSTRLITFFKNGINAVPQISGVKSDYHNLSHHGRDPDKIAELAIIELEQFSALADFVHRLHETSEGESTLLERTMVLFGSNLGNASSHNTFNMPIVLAGGGFRHGQHLAFDRKQNYPLPNLFVSMLQRLGIETDSFVTSTGTMRGLEPA